MTTSKTPKKQLDVVSEESETYSSSEYSPQLQPSRRARSKLSPPFIAYESPNPASFRELTSDAQRALCSRTNEKVKACRHEIVFYPDPKRQGRRVGVCREFKKWVEGGWDQEAWEERVGRGDMGVMRRRTEKVAGLRKVGKAGVRESLEEGWDEVVKEEEVGRRRRRRN